MMKMIIYSEMKVRMDLDFMVRSWGWVWARGVADPIFKQICVF